MTLERLRPLAVLWMDAATQNEWHLHDPKETSLEPVITCGLLTHKGKTVKSP